MSFFTLIVIITQEFIIPQFCYYNEESTLNERHLISFCNNETHYFTHGLFRAGRICHGSGMSDCAKNQQ